MEGFDWKLRPHESLNTYKIKDNATDFIIFTHLNYLHVIVSKSFISKYFKKRKPTKG